jgi:hypothetical protein
VRNKRGVCPLVTNQSLLLDLSYEKGVSSEAAPTWVTIWGFSQRCNDMLAVLSPVFLLSVLAVLRAPACDSDRVAMNVCGGDRPANAGTTRPSRPKETTSSMERRGAPTHFDAAVGEVERRLMGATCVCTLTTSLAPIRHHSRLERRCQVRFVSDFSVLQPWGRTRADTTCFLCSLAFPQESSCC